MILTYRINSNSNSNKIKETERTINNKEKKRNGKKVKPRLEPVHNSEWITYGNTTTT